MKPQLNRALHRSRKKLKEWQLMVHLHWIPKIGSSDKPRTPNPHDFIGHTLLQHGWHAFDHRVRKDDIEALVGERKPAGIRSRRNAIRSARKTAPAVATNKTAKIKL
jgi:hypothetical protein